MPTVSSHLMIHQAQEAKSPSSISPRSRRSSPSSRTSSPRAPSPPPTPSRMPLRNTSDSLISSCTLSNMSTEFPSSPARENLFLLNESSLSTSYSQSHDEPRIDPIEAESLALAHMLMAQEAMESYHMSADFLRSNAAHYSQEDFDALQAVLAEDEAEEYEGAEEEEEDLSYDMMLRLGECIGDVKAERWAMESKRHIAKLPKFCFEVDAVKNLDENDSRRKCLICQFPYEAKEELRRLPCEHCFHVDCVDHWLRGKDGCPYCRQPIIKS